jgi:hypothetical protein
VRFLNLAPGQSWGFFARGLGRAERPRRRAGPSAILVRADATTARDLVPRLLSRKLPFQPHLGHGDVVLASAAARSPDSTLRRPASSRCIAWMLISHVPRRTGRRCSWLPPRRQALSVTPVWRACRSVRPEHLPTADGYSSTSDGGVDRHPLTCTLAARRGAKGVPLERQISTKRQP